MKITQREPEDPLLVIEIFNDKEHKERPARGSYHYTVKVGGERQLKEGRGQVIAEGDIRDHDRTTRWTGLVKQIADQEITQQLVKFLEGFDLV